jgi:hypothetical protein
MKGDGHFALFGALEIGHTLESNVFRAGYSPKCSIMAWIGRTLCLSDRQVSSALFVLAPDTVWYGRLKLLFTISIQSDLTKEVTKSDCAYVSFCFEIKFCFILQVFTTLMRSNRYWFVVIGINVNWHMRCFQKHGSHQWFGVYLIHT